MMGKGKRLRQERTASVVTAPTLAAASVPDMDPRELLPPTMEGFDSLRSVMAECPVTKKFVKTGIAVAVGSAFETSELAGNSFGCSACGGQHTWEEAHAVLDT